MALRVSKEVLVFAIALFYTILVLNNITDYGSNYQFVRHVLSMDTTFPGNTLMYRSIHAPLLHKAFYATIICWESLCCILIGAGALRLWKARRSTTAEWKMAKGLASAGLTASLVQWYFAFMAVGGEWFLMWQSKSWNGQDAAFRMFVVLALTLIYLASRESEA